MELQMLKVVHCPKFGGRIAYTHQCDICDDFGGILNLGFRCYEGKVICRYGDKQRPTGHELLVKKIMEGKRRGDVSGVSEQ